MLKYDSFSEIARAAENSDRKISEIALSDQAEFLEKSEEEIFKEMRRRLLVMKESVASGMINNSLSYSGLSGTDAYKFNEALQQNKTITGGISGKVIARALAVSELNACMGRIVATPTAGSCGVLPAVILTVMEEKNLTEDDAVRGLLTAGAAGMVIARLATIAGAEGGCQAECGSAAAMAAAAAVEMAGGTPEMVENACALALKNLLGLVCDPVAGLVEVPCVKRNAISASVALAAADMALAGIKSRIPVDEVILAMKSIGDMMPSALKETSEAGLATTPEGRKYSDKYHDIIN